MTLNEAKRILCSFDCDTDDLSDEDFFLYTEAMGYLILKTQNPRYMMELGGAYYSRKDYELALRYYEMAAELGYEPASVGLGYIWYYGRTGTVDYQKAFEYFSSAPDNLNACYKVADMYRNGYFVQPDQEKYRRMIRKLYREVKDTDDPFSLLPEIFSRYGGILREDGKTEEALEIFLTARRLLALRLEINPFFGNITIMKYLVRDIHSIRPPHPGEADLYDLFEIFRRPGTASFRYGGRKHMLRAMEEGGEIVIAFDDKWYRSISEFFEKAEADGERITRIAGAVEEIEVS